MPRRVLLLALAVLVPAGPAQAARHAGHVAVRSSLEGDYDIREDYRYTVRRLRYAGEPGAASRLEVRFLRAGRAVLADPGGVEARKGCVQRRRTRVVCRVRGRTPRYDPSAVFALGDGDDVLDLRGRSKSRRAAVSAGPGDDVVGGSAGADDIAGGPGADVLRGRSGGDTFRSGRAPDGADSISGGAGHDEVHFSGRSAGVHADLEGDRDDGESGELDAIGSDVEDLDGGDGPDQLIGDGGDNRLFGGGGSDLLQAGDGDDELLASGGSTLAGGPGDDVLEDYGGGSTLDGGPGRDALADNDELGPPSALAGRDGEGDEIACKGGGDSATADALDMVAGCSGIARDGAPAGRLLFALAYYGGVVPNPLSHRLWWDPDVHRVYVTLGCPKDMGGACAMRLELRLGVRTLLRMRAEPEAGAVGDFDGRLSRSAYRKARGRVLTARLETSDRDGAAVLQTERVTLRPLPSGY
jgi:hypothetical protein